MSKINPYYDPGKLDLEMVCLNEGGLSYEYNTLAFFKSINGVFAVSDSGCSCPTPFEGYESADRKDFERQAEYIRNLEDAEATITSWNQGYSKERRLVSLDEVMAVVEKLREWGLK